MLAFATLVLCVVALSVAWRGMRSTAFGSPAAGLPSLVALLLALGAGVATVLCSGVDAGPRDDGPGPREVVATEDGYIGSGSCRACHPGQHASWHGSFHRSMTQVATRAAVQARFDRLELDWFGEPVLLEWRGDRLWTRFTRRGGRPAAVDRPVVQLTGSHHLQVLWYATGSGRELAPVPMCFKLEEQIWIPLTSVFVLPPEFRDPPEPGAWNRSCEECHTTDARPRFVAGAWDTEVGEFGISCESCHGPGRAHAEANRDPVQRLLNRQAGSDGTIVDPASLPAARSAEVCGHCHSVRILRQRHFEDWVEHGSPFEPGDVLRESHLLVGIGDSDAPELRDELRRNRGFFASNFWADGQVRLSGREFSGLRRSPCFQHGDASRQIDCASCHRMHADDGVVTNGWRDDQLADGMRDNAACTQCHEQLADPTGLAEHTRHAPDSLGSSCYDCHMPHSSIGLMKASRSHEIDSPDVAVELATGRPNACNQCHLDRSLQWTAEHLERGWGIAVPKLDREQRAVAAGVRWLLAGDASQRMLAAWTFGWQPAQRTAGSGWLAPYLARLLDDPYYVVRFNAARSLRTLDGYGGALRGYPFVGEPGQVGPFVDGVTRIWQSRYTGGARPAVLMAERGLDQEAFRRLYARRDDRPVYIAE